MKFCITTLTLVLAGGALARQTPPAPAPTKPRLTLTTDAFEDGGVIPNKFTQAAEGTPVSPKLVWSYVPDGTASFALILRDPDTSLMKKTDEVLHWLIFNIPGTAGAPSRGSSSPSATARRLHSESESKQEGRLLGNGSCRSRSVCTTIRSNSSPWTQSSVLVRTRRKLT